MKTNKQQLKIFIAALVILVSGTFTYADSIYACGYNGIIKFDTNGNSSVLTNASGPISLAIDNSGNLCGLVRTPSGPLGTYTYAVVRYDAGGNATTVADWRVDSDPRYFNFDHSGNIYANPKVVTESGVNRVIEKYDSSGNDLGIFASGADADGCYDMAFDSSGNIYTASFGQIAKRSSDGTYLGVVNKTSMGNVCSLAFDNGGNLWAATADVGAYNSVKKIDAAGNVSTFATWNAGFPVPRLPLGMAFDSSGNLYVNNCSDSYSWITKLDLNGNQSVFASTNGRFYDIAIQTPEPATMVLLGLGGIFIRKLKVKR